MVALQGPMHGTIVSIAVCPNRGSAYGVSLPKLPFLSQDSVADVQGVGSLPTVRLERRLGKLPVQTMNEIKRALVSALDLEPTASPSR
jgi:mRNA interferase MazF